MDDGSGEVLAVLLILAVLAAVFRRPTWRASRTAFGTACWASEEVLRRAGMLAGRGLILGRTLGGQLIRLPRYTHLLLVGATGSGKGVSVIIPQLLTYGKSIIVFDTKGDLFQTTAEYRARMLGQRIVRLAPFNGGADSLNPLDAIPADSPMLVDDARALAESLVVRQGTEPDPHWNDKAVQTICAILVLVLLRFEGEERSLSAVQEIASDTELLAAAADKLRDIGGIPARLGSQLKALFSKDAEQGFGLTREGGSVLSSVAKHLSFTDSRMVADSLARSTFDVRELLQPGPGVTLFLQISPDQLEAQRGWLRCVLSTLIRTIGRAGDERSAEVLCLLDEASALGGGGLAAVEEALVRGRSAGVRLFLAYQSDSQVKAAFKDKPTLIYDNCDTQIYLGATSIETAERISKTLGDWTQVVESAGENLSQSRQYSESTAGGGGGTQVGWSRNWSRNLQPQGRALMRPEEILTMSRDHLIALIAGMPPILARRVKWYADPLFTRGRAQNRGRPLPPMWWWWLLFAALALLGWAVQTGW